MSFDRTADKTERADLMQELEVMRVKLKQCFPAEFNAEKIWKEGVEEKYGVFVWRQEKLRK